MKHSEPKHKPISGKKITYSSFVSEKPSKPVRQGNQFQLIYKIKNRENQNLEDSYESMIMLRSKNKIKRFRYGNEKEKEKEKERSKNQSTNIKEVFERINHKIQEHSKKTSPRLINLLSMSSGSPRSHVVADERMNSKRNKEKSRNRIEKVDMTISTRPNVTRSEKIHRKVRKPIESCIQQKEVEVGQETEYIMLDDGIHLIAQETHKNLTSLMKSTYDKSKLTLHNLEGLSKELESEGDLESDEGAEEDYYPIYQESAMQIQRAWRGYRTRKHLKQHKESLNKQKVNELRMQTSVNGMFIQLFQEIVDLDQQQTKVELLKAFREVLNKNRQSSSSVVQKAQSNIAQSREQAIESQFQAQTNILKYLLITQTITKDDYTSKIDDLAKWGSLKRDQITKLHRTVDETNMKTRQIISNTNEINEALEQVEFRKSSPITLLKCFDEIQKEILSYSFYQSEPSRQSSVAHHLPTEHNQPPEIKMMVQEMESRQNIKSSIEKRMLQQLGYFNVETIPVNTSNIGVHIFLSDLLSYIEEYYKDDFLRWINMPYGYSPESRLKLLQGYDVKPQEEEMGMVEGVQNVLSLEILLEYHKETYNQTQVFNIYHQRALFDAFNECLNVYRPYFSIKGPPYLWNNSQKALTFYFIAEQNIEEVFQKTKQQILKHASSLCGILSDQPDTNLSLPDLIKLKHGCNEMVAECRDQKFVRMEHQLIFSNEGDWSLIEEEKTQTMLNLSELVLAEIIREMVGDIKILNE